MKEMVQNPPPVAMPLAEMMMPGFFISIEGFELSFELQNELLGVIKNTVQFISFFRDLYFVNAAYFHKGESR